MVSDGDKMKMTKSVTNTFSVIFIILAAAVKIFDERSKYEFLIGTLNGDGLILIFLLCACACIVISAICALISKKEKHIVIKTVIRIILLAGILYYVLILSFFTTDKEYYEFASPDGKHSVIAEEWSFLLGGGVIFYERENAFLVTEKESFSTDDGYRVISSGNYSVEWNKNIMTFSASSGNINETVEIESD